MSRDDFPRPAVTPLIVLVHTLDRALHLDMVEAARRRGFDEVRNAHNTVFSVLPRDGARAADMAVKAGITRQSMGEIIRDLEQLGIVETTQDPDDGRAKRVTYTAHGLDVVRGGRLHFIELEERFAAELGVEQYAAVRAGLERIAALLTAGEAVYGVADPPVDR